MANFPDRWVVVALSLNGESSKKVLAGWYGGYLNGDSWKLSSGITQVTKEGDKVFHFDNASGSRYTCQKGAFGMSSLMSGVYSSYEKQLADAGGTMRVLTEEEIEALV
jgi:hypothetical protein